MQPGQTLGRHLADFEVLQVGKATANCFQRGIRLGQNQEQVLAGNRPVRRVNQLPPALDRLLHVAGILGVFHQSVNETVHLALHRLIRN